MVANQTSKIANQISKVENQTSVGLTSDLQGRKLFGSKSEIISDQHLVGKLSVLLSKLV
jgi:hypothetical protein